MERAPNFEFARAGVLASLIVPDVQNLDTQTIVSLRKSNRFTDWHGRFSQILDHADQSFQQGANWGQVRSEVEEVMIPIAQGLVKEVDGSKAITSLKRGIHSSTLAAVGTLTTGATTGHLGVTESLLANGITGSLTTIADARKSKRDSEGRGHLLKHFQAFIGIGNGPDAQSTFDYSRLLEMDAAWRRGERERW
jgi:hypothetical protein